MLMKFFFYYYSCMREKVKWNSPESFVYQDLVFNPWRLSYISRLSQSFKFYGIGVKQVHVLSMKHKPCAFIKGNSRQTSVKVRKIQLFSLTRYLFQETSMLCLEWFGLVFFSFCYFCFEVARNCISEICCFKILLASWSYMSWITKNEMFYSFWHWRNSSIGFKITTA